MSEYLRNAKAILSADSNKNDDNRSISLEDFDSPQEYYDEVKLVLRRQLAYLGIFVSDTTSERRVW